MCLPALHSSTHAFANAGSEKNRISILCLIVVSLQNARIIMFDLFEIEHLNIQSPMSIKGNTTTRSIVFIDYPCNSSDVDGWLMAILRIRAFSWTIRSTATVSTPSTKSADLTRAPGFKTNFLKNGLPVYPL